MALKFLRSQQLRDLVAGIDLKKISHVSPLCYQPTLCDSVSSQIDVHARSKFVYSPPWIPTQSYILSFFSPFSKLAISGDDEEWVHEIIHKRIPDGKVEKVIVTTVKTNFRSLKRLNLNRDKIAAIFSSYKRMYSSDRSHEIEKANEVLTMFGIRIADLNTRFFRSLDFVSKGKCVPILKYLSEELKIENLASALSENSAAMYWDVSEVKRRIDLIQSFGVKDVRKLLFLKRGLMHQSISSIERSMTFLVSLVGKELACTMVQKNIVFLATSAETVRDNFAYLERTFGAKDTRTILASQPHVLCATPSKRETILTELTRLFGRENCLAMVKKFPVLLVLEWNSNLSPKLDYILNKMNGRREEIINRPNIMCYSLEKRMKPRFECLKEVNVEEKLLSLRALLSSTDDEFKALILRVRKVNQ